MTMFHYRVVGPGKAVHTFCGLVVPRTETKKFKFRFGMALSNKQVKNNSDDTCRTCIYIGCQFRLTYDGGRQVEITKRELDVRKGGLVRRKTHPPEWLTPPERTPLELCQHAMAAGELMGVEINAKRTAAEKAVTTAQEAVAKLESKLRMTTTCLKNAQKRLAVAEKNLSKTEKYEPPTFEEEEDDEDENQESESENEGGEEGSGGNQGGIAAAGNLSLESA